MKYVADPHHGFQVVSATNLPKGPAPVAHHAIAPVAVAHWDVPAYAPWAAHHHGAPLPVQKTPEVLAAEHKHFAAVAEAKARLHHHHKRSVGPVDTPEVQHEKQIHFAAHQRALAGLPANPILYHPQLAQPAHYNHAPAHYASAPQYSKYHYEPAPAPVNGVPQDTAEVAHAKANHLALVAHAKAHAAPAHYNHAPAHYAPSAPSHYAPEAKYGAWHGPIHVPVIHNGVPEETPEVQAAKAKHFSLVHEAQAHQSHSYTPSYNNGHEDDGSYDAKRYENEAYYH